jgi:hypothetical protein
MHRTDKRTFFAMPKPACCKRVHGERSLDGLRLLRASDKNLQEAKRKNAGNYLQRTEWMSLESGRSHAISTVPSDACHRSSTAEDNGGHVCGPKLLKCSGAARSRNNAKRGPFLAKEVHPLHKV